MRCVILEANLKFDLIPLTNFADCCFIFSLLFSDRELILNEVYYIHFENSFFKLYKVKVFRKLV